ncbi:MAG TPA: NAD(P)H-binding protein [Solirubrobacterales bacterium]|jgi:uncharacterized protein YbjT (DUF2867 family)
MKVAVAGGTGTLGSLVAAELATGGDEVLALSRHAPRGPREGVTHRSVDLGDGTGLAEALAGVDVLVDAANRPPSEGRALVAITRRLLDAAGAAGVRHFVGVSIVGCDRVPIPYYKAKVEQEEAIAAGPVPWSLVRATQFHDLLAWAFEAAARRRVLPTGRARLQPIDVRVAAGRFAATARGEPGGRLPDVAGPEVRTLSELARAWRAADGRRLLPLRIPMVGRIGRPVREGALCDPAAAAGGATFEQWLAGR